jgi:hypothetical protein
MKALPYLLWTLAIGALVIASLLNGHNRAASPTSLAAWSSEVLDWNGGKILKIGYADPLLGIQYHIVPYVVAESEP